MGPLAPIGQGGALIKPAPIGEGGALMQPAPIGHDFGLPGTGAR